MLHPELDGLLDRHAQGPLLATVLHDDLGRPIHPLPDHPADQAPERKQVEQSLRENEERYRTLFNEAHDAIILENTNEEILDANQSASKLFGYTLAELLTMRSSKKKKKRKEKKKRKTKKREFK